MWRMGGIYPEAWTSVKSSQPRNYRITPTKRGPVLLRQQQVDLWPWRSCSHARRIPKAMLFPPMAKWKTVLGWARGNDRRRLAAFARPMLAALRHKLAARVSTAYQSSESETCSGILSPGAIDALAAPNAVVTSPSCTTCRS